jgi:hypothetical protein
MSLTIARLVTLTQAGSPSNRNTVHTVPTNTMHVVKSIILRSARSDSQAVIYELGIIPAGQSYGNQHALLKNQSIVPGDTRIIDFSLLVLNAGDTVYINPTLSGLYYEAYGMVSA